MSEAEKKRRALYKKNRKRHIFIGAILLIITTVLSLSSAITYFMFNDAYYIDYIEAGDVRYAVYLKDNDFYEEDHLGEGQSYVASLIKHVLADFRYDMQMDASDIRYEYSYKIDATLLIEDTKTGAPLFSPTYDIRPEQKFSTVQNRLSIREQVTVDYDTYNDLAHDFINTYNLNDTKSSILFTMHVNVLGTCAAASENCQSEYTVSLRVPLVARTVRIDMTESVPSAENKILAVENGTAKDISRIFTFVFTSLDAVLLLAFIIFVYVTRNDDINYEIKIKRLLANYKSYIQRIQNAFDREGYQVLLVSSFNELLEIRDTLQSPILMCENEDKTKTDFIIPTHSNILYIHEIKVEDYDDLYRHADSEAPLYEAAVALAPEEIDVYDEEAEPVEAGDVQEEIENGVDAIGVSWEESIHKGKVYRYDPDGKVVDCGDTVLVPTKNDKYKEDVVREATVAQGNHKIDPHTLRHPLKKVISVVKRKTEDTVSEKQDTVTAEE